MAYLAINSADKNKTEITKNYLNLVENLQNFSENDDFFKHFQAMYFRLQAEISKDLNQKRSFIEQAEIAEKHYKNLLTLAQISAEEKNFEISENLCNQAEKLAKNNVEKSAILFARAKIYAQQNNINEAKNFAENAIKEFFNNKAAWQLLSTISSAANLGKSAAFVCENILKIDPFDENAYVNLGERLRRLRQVSNAIQFTQQGMLWFSKSAFLWANLGTLMQENHNDKDAIRCYEMALKFNPEIPQVLNNLANLYKNAHDDVKARDTLRKSYDLMISQNNSDRNSLVDITLNLAGFELSLANPQEALILCEKCLQIPMLTAKQKLSAKKQLYAVLNNLKENAENSENSENADFPREKQIFLQNLKQEIQQNILLEVKKQNENINSNSHNFPQNVQTVLQRLQNNITALIPVGRAGSMFLHSLIDFHPQISTLPSVYFKGFFAKDLWARLYPPAENLPCLNNNWREHFILQFCQMYAVFFDARNPQEVPGAPMHRGGNLGEKSGTAQMGENRNEFLSVDKNLFCQNLLNLFNYCQNLSPKLAFLLIHIAFEQTLGRNIENLQAIFYHIHNPDFDEYSHFIANFPSAKILIITREPLQNLDSSMANATKNFQQTQQNADFPREHRKIFCAKIYKEYFHAIAPAMHGATDAILFREKFNQEIIALTTLEKLKTQPQITMRKIAEFIGVSDVENENLLQSTFQGKMFHSPTSSVSPTISGFDKSNLQRKNIAITDENDIDFLQNIFYPLRKFCEYCESQIDLATALENNLQWLAKNEMFGFEKSLAEFFGDAQEFKNLPEFKLIRETITKTIKKLLSKIENAEVFVEIKKI